MRPIAEKMRWLDFENQLSTLHAFKPFGQKELDEGIDAYLSALRECVRREVETVLAEHREARAAK